MAKDLGDITFKDYSPQVLKEMQGAALRALERNRKKRCFAE